jgi:hypothetical protein
MAIKAGSLMKVDYVLEIARKDPRFLNDLSRDTFRTLDESAIDLSKGELIALLDIVKNSSHSTLAPLLGDLRKKWQLIIKDQAKDYGE